MRFLHDISRVGRTAVDLNEDVPRDVGKLDKDQRTEIVLLPEERKMPHIDARFGKVDDRPDVVLVGKVKPFAFDLEIRRRCGRVVVVGHVVVDDQVGNEFEDPVELDGDAGGAGRKAVSLVDADALANERGHLAQVEGTRLGLGSYWRRGFIARVRMMEI